MTMRVNLIHSKLVFFFFKIQKLNTLKKKRKKKEFTQTIQVNCTVHVNIKFQKTAMSCFVKFTFKA